MNDELEFPARFNHVAMSVEPALLHAEGRATLLDFYGSVFDWTEGDNTGESNNPLIMYTGAPGQFLYVLAGDDWMRTPPLDHFGFQVATGDELLCRVDRARAYQQRDPRVRIIDIETRTTHGPTHDYTLTSAYIGFLLPLMVELQHLVRGATRSVD
jgi:hypothetical protein